MSDPLPEDPHGQPPETEARAPIDPSVQGTVPAWDDAVGSADPTHEQLVMEARARQALRAAALRDEASAEEPLEAGAGFTVERGGRSAMAETAGKIGTAVGSAHREVRRRLELVRRPARAVEFPSAAELADSSARMMREIDTEVADVRKQAARKLDDWSGQADEHFQQLRRDAQQALKRSSRRARELAEAYPLQTIAAVAGTFFLIGVALRLGRSRRG
jgi:ElaB/YqjD/DUF883 family membrane-anchored ribosome-binding protein